MATQKKSTASSGTTVRRRRRTPAKKTAAPRRRRMSAPKTKGKRALKTTTEGFLGGAAADLLSKSLVGVNLPGWVAPAAPLVGAWVTDRFFNKSNIAAGMAGASAAGVVDVVMDQFFGDNSADDEQMFMRPTRQLNASAPDNPMALQDYGYQGLSADPYSSDYSNFMM